MLSLAALDVPCRTRYVSAWRVWAPPTLLHITSRPAHFCAIIIVLAVLTTGLSCHHRERSLLVVEFPYDAHRRVLYRSRFSTAFTADEGPNETAGVSIQYCSLPCRRCFSVSSPRTERHTGVFPLDPIKVWSFYFAAYFVIAQGAGPLGRPRPASYFTVSWYKLPGLLEYSGGWWFWLLPGRNPSVTMNALALNDELVEVDHLLGG